MYIRNPVYSSSIEGRIDLYLDSSLANINQTDIERAEWL